MARAKSAYKIFQLQRRVKSFNWDQKHAGIQLLMAELTGEKSYVAAVSSFCDFNTPHGGANYTEGLGQNFHPHSFYRNPLPGIRNSNSF